MTDSVFFSAAPILNHRHQGWEKMDDQEVAGLVNGIAEEMQNYLNEFYNHLAKRVFNLDKHRFEVKKEFVSKSGIWIAKKRYAQWIISDNGVAVDKLDVKGLDVVRSSFPKAFRKLMSKVLIDILKGNEKKDVTKVISSFRDELPNLSISEIAKNSSVKGLKKYAPKEKTMFKFNKSTPAHVKAAIAYNQMLIHFNAAYKYSPFKDGDKLKWVYLKNNPFGLSGLGFSAYRDPDEVIEFIENYIDYDKIFERELLNKLQDFYDTLGWGEVINSQEAASEFFDFG